jgi:hypothetical protein
MAIFTFRICNMESICFTSKRILKAKKHLYSEKRNRWSSVTRRFLDEIYIEEISAVRMPLESLNFGCSSLLGHLMHLILKILKFESLV